MARLSKLIGHRIRELRKSRNLRQEDMEKFGLSYKYYQRIEAGKVNLTLKTIERIAEAFGIDVVELLSIPLSKTPEVNELAAVLSEIIKKDDKKTAKRVVLFIREFLNHK